MNAEDLRTRFAGLHRAGTPLVMPNAWDAGSARLLTNLGFAAIGTTSAGYAYSQGMPDSIGSLRRDDVLDNAAQIADAVAIPVSADLIDGFGEEPETCAETIQAAIRCGLAGGSIEDATGENNSPIYPIAAAVARVQAAAHAAQTSGFVLTARAESYLWGREDLSDTIARLQAYAEAGADVVFAPGLTDLQSIRTVCRELDVPVSVVMGLSGSEFTVDQLAEAGVARISTGGSLVRAAYGALIDAGTELHALGTFRYARKAVPDADMTKHMLRDSPADKTP